VYIQFDSTVTVHWESFKPNKKKKVSEIKNNSWYNKKSSKFKSRDDRERAIK